MSQVVAIGSSPYDHVVAERVLRVYAFVDGGQLRSALEELGVDWTRLDVFKLCAAGLPHVGGNWHGLSIVMSRVFIYDAVPADTESGGDGRVGEWLSLNNKQKGVHVRRGHLAGDPARRKPRRQKAVDVQLAVDALTYTANGVFDMALLVTGDGDFAPVAEAVRDRGPLVAAYSFKSKLSQVLSEVADRVGYLPEGPEAYEGRRLSV